VPAPVVDAGLALAIVAWFVLAPLGYLLYRLWEGNEPLAPLLSGTMQSAAMFAAVLLFGEAVRGRRLLLAEQERSERLLLNVLPAPIAARDHAGPGRAGPGRPVQRLGPAGRIGIDPGPVQVKGELVTWFRVARDAQPR
jgi:hypothetical protein